MRRKALVRSGQDVSVYGFSYALIVALVIKEVELWGRDNNKAAITQCWEAIGRTQLNGIDELLSASEHTSTE